MKFLLGVHHKTGTHLIHDIFSEICEEFSLQFWHRNREPNEPTSWDVAFDENSQLHDLMKMYPEHRGLHIVRDPRDVIISGAHYHAKATEPWLQQPREDLQGRSYQEVMKSFASDRERYIFEMNYSGGFTTREMFLWNYENPNFYEAKYEQLAHDVQLKEFQRIFEFLDLPGVGHFRALEIAYNNSLFSGRDPSSMDLVRDGSKEQYKRLFDPELNQLFIAKYPGYLEELGYFTEWP